VNEFELIDRFFTRSPPPGGLVRQGIGDDCALLDCGERLLAVTTDLLVEGRHFLVGADAASLGHKALAVNLSDLAAAGATPCAFQLALALPRADEKWLDAFARGLFALADEHGCALIGGDTTRVPQLDASASRPIDGPLTICITAIGELPRQFARTRAGARAGDDLWVSGTLGDAGAALAWRRGELHELSASAVADCAARMDRPQPRIALGVALRGIATSAIDLSDGLLGDLGHILKRSRVGARLDWARLPRSEALQALPLADQQRFALAGGDDYELLFSAAADRRADVEAAAASAAVAVTRIGTIVAGDQLCVHDAQGRQTQVAWHAYDHFGG
jgi:thiamine-monophosphate kinase